VFYTATGAFTSPAPDNITVHQLGTLTLDTRITYQNSGPCGFISMPRDVSLQRKGDTSNLFYCNLQENSTYCENTVTDSTTMIMLQESSLTENNALNFKVTVPKVGFDWSGEFVYRVIFPTPRNHILTKSFIVNVIGK